MASIEMVVDSIRVSMMNYQRVVILKEKDGVRHLPIWIGPAEADAIAAGMQSISPPRPMTHDFACQIIDSVGGSVESALIDELVDDTFAAKLVLSVKGKQIQIDCRPSDALAVAVRADVPIFADDKVVQKAGIVIDGGEGEPFPGASSRVTTTLEQQGKSPLETFSESVRNILDEAEAEAKSLNCSYHCTGHLLLALVKEMNMATKVMKSAGTDPGRAQLDIKSMMSTEQAIEGGGVGLTAAAKETIRISIAEAKRLGSKKVLPEHVLLGLVRTADGMTAKYLKDSGITPEMIYAELIRLYAGTGRGV